MIRNKTYKLVSLVAALLLLIPAGYSSAISSGQIVIHTNQAYYITGDVLKYKLYLPQSFKNQDKVIRICFSKNDNELVNESFLKTGNSNSVSSELKIPFDLSSGMYYLLLSSYNESLNEEVVLFEIPIPVYSDLQNDLKSFQPHQGVIDNSLNKTVLEGNININTRKITRRNKIQGSIELTNSDSGNEISLSVNDIQFKIPEYKTVFTSDPLDSQLINGLSDKLYLSGQIVSAKNSEEKKFPVIAIYGRDENSFSYLQTDVSGNFHFTTDDFHGYKNIQFINYDNEDISVLVNTPKISRPEPTLIVTEEILQHLELSRKRKKINQLFSVGSETQKFKQTNWEKKSIKDSKLFDFKKYESFENISAFFSEIMSALRFTKKEDGTYRAQVFNRDRASRGFYKGTPVFVIDGMVSKDASFVNALDYNKVNSIEIVSDIEILKATYGPIGYNGIIYISTSLPAIRLPLNESNNVFTLKGFTSAAEVEQDSFSEMGKRIPVFSSNISWLDDLVVQSDGSVQFEFEHTDDLGEFEIEVIGVSNNGELVRSTVSYKVE